MNELMKYKYLLPSKIDKSYENKKVFQINLPKPPSKSEIKLMQVTQVTDTPKIDRDPNTSQSGQIFCIENQHLFILRFNVHQSLRTFK